MPDPQDYISKAYAAIKDNLQGFDKSPEQFKSLVTSDSAYRSKVYNALRENVEGFNKTSDDFDGLVGVQKKSLGGNDSQNGSTNAGSGLSKPDEVFGFDKFAQNQNKSVDPNYPNVKKPEKVFGISQYRKSHKVDALAPNEIPPPESIDNLRAAPEDFAGNEQFKQEHQKQVDIYNKAVELATPAAIESAARKSLKIKGINPNNTALLNKEKAKFTEQIKNGQAEVALDKDKKAGLVSINDGWWSNFHGSMMNAINANKEAREFQKMSIPERVEYANKKIEEANNTPYIGDKPSEGAKFASTLGGAAPTLALYGAGALAGGTLETLAPATGGLSNVALKPVMSFAFNVGGGANHSALQNVTDRYYKIKQQNPNIPDEVAMSEAGKGEEVDRLAGIAETALFSTIGGEAKVGKSVTGNIMKGAIKSGLDVGLKTGGVEVGRQLAQGENVSEALKGGLKKFEENAPVGSLLHLTTSAITGVLQAPKIVKNALKFDTVNKIPPDEINALLQKNVEQGNITPEVAQKTINDLTEFKQALDKVPDNLGDDAKASVAGLILKRDNIKLSMEGKDESAKDLHNTEVESINNQIKEIYRTGKPLEHEINEATGEPYKQPTFDEVQKQRVEDLADKIASGKRIEDAEDLSTEANFPDELQKQLTRLSKEETSANKDKEKPNTDVSKNVEKYLSQQEKEKPDAVADVPLEEDKGVKDVYSSNEELSKIGTAKEYEEYLKSIFPNSKVKQVVYHGSDTNIENFDKSKSGSGAGNLLGKGIYFSTDKGKIKFYVEDVAGKKLTHENPSIVNIENPHKTKGLSANPEKSNDGIITSMTQEVVVNDPSQIHRLGSKADIEGFKKWKESKSKPQTPTIVEDKNTANEIIQKTNTENKQSNISAETSSPTEKGTTETPPPTTATEKEVAHLEYPPTSLNYRGTGKLETEFGIDERIPTKTKHDIETIKEADNLLEKGWNVNDAVNKIEAGEHIPSDAEYINMTRFGAELSARLRDLNKDVTSPDFNKTLRGLNKVAAAADSAGQATGRVLGLRGRYKVVQDGTYADFMLGEMDANKGADLTDTQKKTATKDFTELENLKKAAEEKVANLEAQVAKLKAENELKKVSKSVDKNVKKTHEDFVKDRKDIIEAAKEKIKKAREKAQDIQQMGIGGRTKIDDLITIAPEVLKIAKSYVEEGVVKLENIVSQLHDNFKDVVEDLSEKDVHDILAGEYKESKPTKTEVATQMQNIRTQAKLINTLEKKIAGTNTKTEKGKQQKEQVLEELRQKIKDFDRENPDYEAQLKSLKNKYDKQFQRLKERADKGDFEPEEKKIPLIQRKEVREKFPDLLKEAVASRDAWIKKNKEIQIRRAKLMFKNRTPQDKFGNALIRGINVPRTLMASMDFSAPLRQGIVASIAHPVLAEKASKFMFEVAKSEKLYNRWIDEVHNSPRWAAAEKSKLAVTDPNTLHLKEKEEAFLGSSYAEQIPIAGELVKGSERAYVGFLNKLRWDLFNQYADRFEANGKTFENSPELYKGLASFVNSSTGRGGMALMENAAPVLNIGLFSPRLIASRLNMLGLTDIPNLALRLVTFGQRGVDYGFYTKLPPEIRIEAAKDMLKFLAAGITTLALAKYAFGAQVETDPRSTDFGKIKSGNTRWDLWGGFQPYARLLSQVVTGQSKSATTGKVYELDGKKYGGRTIGDQLATFGRGKLAPVLGAVTDVITGRTLDQQTVEKRFDIPFYKADNPEAGNITITDELLREVTPLLFNDVKEAMQDRGISALFTVGLPSTFGVGVQTYSPQTKGGSGGGGGATGGLRGLSGVRGLTGVK